MYNFLFIIMALSLSFFSFSQTSDSIRTARPGIGIGAFVVGQKVLQVQSGVTYDQARGTQSLEQYTLDNVIRYGLSEKYELSAVINYSHLDLSSENLDGINSTQLGFRMNLLDKPNAQIKGIGLQFRFKLPWESSDYKSNDISGVMILAIAQKLGENLDLTYNIGITENQAIDKISGFYTIGLSTSLNSKWGTFIETYGNLDDGDHDLFIDSGLSYLKNKNLQYDLSFGGGRNDGLSTYFVSLGVSWRLLP